MKKNNIEWNISDLNGNLPTKSWFILSIIYSSTQSKDTPEIRSSHVSLENSYTSVLLKLEHSSSIATAC